MALHTSTIITRTPAALISYLARLPITYTENPLLFTLSTNVVSSELSTLVSRLTTLSSQTIGCLSAPLEGHGISCSLASFDKNHSVPFRSTIPGRPPPQVGRWHSFRERDQDSSSASFNGTQEGGLSEEGINWEEVWGRSIRHDVLPRELDVLSPNDVNAVIYFSDMASQGLSNALAALPLATKLGLVASSTPFITGRPVTLFQNDRIYSTGAVGIALTNFSKRPVPRIEFPGLKALTEPLTVTRSEGNLINELNNGNPTQLLLSVIRKHIDTDIGSFKDDHFYLGALRRNQLNKIYRITSGDPIRGTIAVESDVAPVAGTQVQLYHHLKTMERREYTSPSSGRVLSLISSPYHATVTLDSGEGTRVLPEHFLAASENGMIISRSADSDDDSDAEVGWSCVAQGLMASLTWM